MDILEQMNPDIPYEIISYILPLEMRSVLNKYFRDKSIGEYLLERIFLSVDNSKIIQYIQNTDNNIAYMADIQTWIHRSWNFFDDVTAEVIIGSTNGTEYTLKDNESQLITIDEEEQIDLLYVLENDGKCFTEKNEHGDSYERCENIYCELGYYNLWELLLSLPETQDELIIDKKVVMLTLENYILNKLETDINKGRYAKKGYYKKGYTNKHLYLFLYSNCIAFDIKIDKLINKDNIAEDIKDDDLTIIYNTLFEHLETIL